MFAAPVPPSRLLRRKSPFSARLLSILAILLILFNPLLVGLAAPQSQSLSAEDQARQFLERLSPEERVGQLFMATFKGTDTGEISQIYDLITNHHVGGVVLLKDNDNFSTEEDSLSRIRDMTEALQISRWNASQEPRIDPASGESYTINFTPLFIGTAQEGDGYPNDQILRGMTPLPNEMAMGATWDPNLTAQVGSVLGNELSALGFNLLLGPSLDVLETPRPEDTSDLGTRTFGGDPFWVGEMGQAFIKGVHQGSNGKMAVIAKHFPGNGGADRLPEEEVATVRKSFEELKNFDLAPFFAVTGNAISSNQTDTASDGLLVSHIRYQGFQENIRLTTRPLSLSKQDLNSVMSLPELAVWRENGGILVSDNLGSRAMRRFYELTAQPYDAWSVARNAFLAGNDLLYLGDITSGEDPDSYTTTIKVMDAFAQKYREDPSFAEQVNTSVLRILTLKFRLYPSFSLRSIIPPEEGISAIGQSSQVTFDVARQAATLISPSLGELNDAMPDPPNLNDRITFITDTRSGQPCSQCPPEPYIDVQAMEQAVLRLYGPQGGGQVLPGSLSSFSFEELLTMLDSERNTTTVESELQRTHWVVFAILDESPDFPASQALRRFLTERPDLFQHKRLVVFAFNAPYYLDATNISKITAYFGVYSKSPSFFDVAARLLFRELIPEGALPVSVPGTGYDLISATSPNPDQIIPLYSDIAAIDLPEVSTTPAPALSPTFQLGDLIPVRTGVIYDHNGNPVPDGTVVQFLLTINGEPGTPIQAETVAGVARATIQGNSTGKWEVRAESEPAQQSDSLHFEIPSETGEVITITPTPQPTETPTPTLTPTVPPPVTTTPEPLTQNRPDLTDWLVALFLTTVSGLSAYRVAASIGQVRWGVRGGFLALIGGLLAYSYLALGLPGSEGLLQGLGAWGVILPTLFGCLVGVAAAWSWRSIHTAASSDST